MNQRAIYPCARIIVLYLWVALPAWADPMPMSTGDLPGPAVQSQVAMVEEHLNIDVLVDRVEVEAIVLLHNRGEAIELDVGFPCRPPKNEYVAGLNCKTKLDIRADGKKVRARKLESEGEENHWTWKMSFPADARVSLEVRYSARLENENYTRPLAGTGTLYYRLATGARWAGPIERLTMKVRLPVDTVSFIAPAGYIRTPGEISWELKDAEPDDLVIDFAAMYNGRVLNALAIGKNADVLERREQPAAPSPALCEVASQFRQDVDRHIDSARMFYEDIRVRQALPVPTEEAVRACVAESARLMELAAACE